MELTLTLKRDIESSTRSERFQGTTSLRKLQGGGRGDMFNYVRRERVMETSWQFLMDLRSVSHYPVFGAGASPP